MLVRTRIGIHKGILGRFASNLTLRYDSLVHDGAIMTDPVQLKTVKLLDKLRGVIENFDFSSLQKPGRISNLSNNSNENHTPRLRGMYIYGSVGTGKTMLMDLLFRECRIEKKRKVHFHQFMLEVHRRIHHHKQFLLQKYGRQRHINLSEDQDSIRYIAKEIAKEANLLCFDEFQVTDICDAVIMTKLFDTLWSQGVVLVATSNRPPDDLYLNGMNRPDFLPFIDRLKQECIVRELDSGKDYRVLRHSGSNSSTSFDTIQQMQYLYPLSDVNRDKFYWNYGQELQSLREESMSIRSFHVKKASDGKIEVSIPNTNRFIVLDQAEPEYGIGLVDFKTLCQTDRGASDYHALASTFHTIYLSNIPRLTKENHNAARRFITLVDELYNANARLVCFAEASPHELFLDVPTVPLEELSNSTAETEKLVDCADMKKYSRNHSPARISLSASSQPQVSLLADESTIGEKYGDMGQQEEISVVESELASIQELSFAFQRATSRLLEMNSAHYYQVWQNRYIK